MALNKQSQRVWQKASGILLNEVLELDANEHVGLLTVIGGMRSVALFLSISDTDATKLMHPLRSIRLKPILARGPVQVYTWESPHPPEITRMFRTPLESLGLWVCRDLEDARTIRDGVDQITAGRLPGYPGCCIESQQRDKARFEDAAIRGCVRAFGDGPAKIAQALLEDRKVSVEFEPGDTMERTAALFPFVQHVACESCLMSADTPTAVLNSKYRDLVAEVDPVLHGYLMRLAERVGGRSRQDG